MAIGSVGADKRLWFARISQGADRTGPGSFHVKVFHTATKTVPGGSETPDDDPQEVFAVAWLAEYGGSDPGARRLLLVGRCRRGAEGGVGSRRPPLAIDLDSLAVSVLPIACPDRLPPQVVRGHVVAASEEGIDLFSPPDQKTDHWTHRALVEFPRPEIVLGVRPLLLSHGGMVYRPGAHWIRVDPKTWNVERLRTTTVPGQDPFERYAVSAHYGLVGWNRGGQCCRISIVPCPSSSDDLAALYPYVPAPARASHHRAVQAIRGLGGSVDTRWGFCRHAFESPEPGPYRPNPDSAARTIVYLPEGWKGGDAGLAHLEDLYRLRDFYLVRAAVSDQGLQAVGRLRELESLYLIETKATDAGLAHLGGLEQLVYLRLEGTAGGRQFTDKGLEHLRNLPKLRKLTLYGDGFTDEGLAALGGLSNLRLLYLLNARITQAGLEKIVAARKQPLVWHRDPQWWHLID